MAHIFNPMGYIWPRTCQCSYRYFHFAGTVRAEPSQNDVNDKQVESAAATEKHGGFIYKLKRSHD